MPGSPPTSTTAPSTSPPPSTRSNSPMPVLTRASSWWRTSPSAVTFGASTLPAQPLRRGGGFKDDLRKRIPRPALAALALALVEFGAAFGADIGGPGLGHAWIPDLGNGQDSRAQSRGTRCQPAGLAGMTGGKSLVRTSLAGVVVGAIQRAVAGCADAISGRRPLRLALLEDLRRLGIGRNAVLQRLAQLDAGRGQPQGVAVDGD